MRHKFIRTPDPMYVDSVESACDWVARYIDAPSVGFDTETTGLHKTNARIKFFSFSDGATRICAPVRLLEIFAPVLEEENIDKRMTNAKFDMHMAANHGILIRGRILDTIPMDWLIDENRQGRHGLKETARDYLGLRMAPFKEVFGSVGSVEKEVKMVTSMHDALEADNSDYAADLLVQVGKADGPAPVKKSLQKLALSKQAGYVLTAKQLLAMGRAHGIVPVSKGKHSYIADFVGLVTGKELPVAKDRAAYAGLLEDKELLRDATDILLYELRKQIAIDIEPLEMLRLLVADYASLDAWASYTLADTLQDHLDTEFVNKDETLLDYFSENSVPFTRVLWNCERRGIPIDLDAVEEMKTPMAKTIGQIERKVVRIAKRDVNLRSVKQLRDLFYTQNKNGEWEDPFGNKPEFWTKGGASGVKEPSTAHAAIESWAERGNSLASAMLEFRELSKLYDTYLSGMPEWVDHKSRVHSSLVQTGAVTGRLASQDPGLQNIPIKSEEGAKIRKLFVPGLYGDCDPSWCTPEVQHVPVPNLPPDTPMIFVVADYEQLEMRIMAHFSEAENMIEAICLGQDMHCKTATWVGGYDYDKVLAAKKAEHPTDEQKALVKVRSDMKAVGFGLIYGIGPVKLGRNLGLPIIESISKRTGKRFESCPEAAQLIRQYFDVLPDVEAFITNTKEQCREDLFVRTYVGRYRRLPDILSGERGIAAQAERQSCNSIIQGSAADICNKAMLNCETDEELRELGVRMLLQIHDELVFEVPDIPEYVDAAKIRIRELMENPYPMRVPILISMKSGYSWGDCK